MALSSIRKLLASLSRSRGSRSGGRPSKRTFRPQLEFLEGRIVPAIDTWTGANHAVDNNWSDPKNWSLQRAPGASDTANFTFTGTKSFQSVVDSTFTVAALTMDSTWGSQGGTVTVNSPLAVTGNFELDSGNFIEGKGSVTIGGSNSKWTNGLIDLASGGFLNTGTFHVDTTSSTKVLNLAGTLTNQGTIDLDGPHFLDIRSNAVLNNTGTFNFTGDGSVEQLFGGTFTNAGTVEKTGGTGTSFLRSTFNNNGGTLDAQTGKLAVDSAGGLVNGGTLQAASGATLDLTGGGTVSYAGTFTGSGAGTVALSGGTLAVASSGATFDLPGSLFQWTGGTIDVSSGGTLTNAATGVFNTNGTNLGLTGAGNLTNHGTLNAGGVSNIVLTSGASVLNASGATFDFTGNSDVATDGSRSGGTFTNDGLIEKTGTGTSPISSAFTNNGGAITVQTGTLSLRSYSGLINGGTLTVASHATLNLADSVTTDYAGTITGSGAGSVVLKTYGTLKVASGGATFNLPGSLFQITGGTLDVSSGNLTNSGVINIAGNQDVVLTGAGSLINNKNINQTSTAYFVVGNKATLNNVTNAVYNLAGDGSIGVSGTGTLLNAGVVRKSAGSGKSYIQAPLNNTGTVQVLSGTLDITGTVTQISDSTLTAGSWMVNHSATSNATLKISSAGTLTTIGAKARVTLNGSNTTFTNLSGLNAILAGGSFTLAGGQSFTTAGALTNSGSILLSPGSVLAVSAAFTDTSTGKLTVQIGGTSSSPTSGSITAAGPVSLGGTLTVTSTVTPAVGSSFEILNNLAASAITGAFAGLAEGATFSVKVGATIMTFKITYAGGTGNDVVITHVS